jgi:hypothetical protein
MRPRNGKYTNGAWAKRMLALGQGLSEQELDNIHANINRIIRARVVKARTPADEFREMLELNYQRRRT